MPFYLARQGHIYMPLMCYVVRRYCFRSRERCVDRAPSLRILNVCHAPASLHCSLQHRNYVCPFFPQTESTDAIFAPSLTISVPIPIGDVIVQISPSLWRLGIKVEGSRVIAIESCKLEGRGLMIYGLMIPVHAMKEAPYRQSEPLEMKSSAKSRGGTPKLALRVKSSKFVRKNAPQVQL